MDIHDIRLTNLRELAVRANGRPKLAVKLDMSYQLLQNYIGKTPVKRIGDKTARKAEAAFGLPHGWMDQVHKTHPYVTALSEISTEMADLTKERRTPGEAAKKSDAMGLDARIALVMHERNCGVDEIAVAANVDHSIVDGWLNGTIKSLSLESAVALQQKFGYNPVWLALGKGEEKMPDIHHEDPWNPIPFPAGKRIPVLGMAQLGDNGFWAEVEYPVGHGDGYLDFPSRDRDAYGIRCVGDSMLPRIKDGEFVVIEPNHPVENGDEVLVKAKDGRVMIKILLYQRGGRTHLMSVNTEHAPLAIDTEKIERLHYVAAIVKPSMWRHE